MLEVWLAVGNTVGVVLVGVGLIATWRQNGRKQETRDLSHALAQSARDQASKSRDLEQASAQAARDQQIKSNQENILSQLSESKRAASAIYAAQEKQKDFCLKTSTKLIGRADTAERDIGELKKK